MGSYVDEVDFDVLNIQKPTKNIGIHMDVTWKSKSNPDLGVVDLSLMVGVKAIH